MAQQQRKVANMDNAVCSQCRVLPMSKAIRLCILHEAAPQLLAACKEALEQLKANMPKGNIRDADHFHALNHHAAACKSLHAAIQHAEGRE